jgi:hypothetical protein
VRSKRTKQFRTLFAALPASVQREANEAYRRFQADPAHPSLHLKQVKAHGPVYAARVGLHYRALAIRKPDYWLWFWIGTHAEYDKLLAQL